MTVRILNGDVEPLYYQVLDELGQGLTGLANLSVRVSRVSDDYVLDWDDDTFKASGWTTPDKAVTEVDATDLPGQYKVAGGLDTGAITNLAASDTLIVTISESPAANGILVSIQEIKVGQWPEQLVDQTAFDRVGYANGAVWIDTIDGTPGTVDFVNGTADNPVNTIADARTLASSLGLKRFAVAPGSSITLASATNGFVFEGKGWTLALGGQSINDSIFRGASVSGIGVASSPPTFEDCIMGVVTLPPMSLNACGLTGPITMSGVGDYFWDQCWSTIAGTVTPVVNFGAAIANTNLSMRHYSGGIELQNMGASGTDTMSLEGHGQLVLNANCVGGTVAIRGTFTIVDNAGGAVTLSDNARYDVQQVRDAQKLAPTAGAPVVGSVDEHLDDILTDTSAIDTRLPSDPADESLQQAAHTQTQADIAALNDLAIVDVQTALTTQGYTAARAPNLDNLDVAVSTRSDFDEASDPVELLDLGGTAGTSAAELVDDIETKLANDHGSGQWDGTDSDWTVAERQQIRDALGVAGTKTAATGGQLQTIGTETAAIDGRLPSDPADESLQQAAHTQTQADIAALNDLAIADVQTALTNQGYTAARAPNLDNLDAAVSSRSDFDETTDPVELLDAGGTAGTSAAELVTDIDTDLSATHGSGSWESAASSSDWTAGEREQIRYRLAMDGTQANPTTNTGTIEDILADTDAVDTRLPSDPADESLQQASHTTTQAAIAALSDLDPQGVRDAMKLTPTPGAAATGSVDEHLDDILADTTAIDGRLPSDPADESLQQAAHTQTQADIAALNDLSQADIQTAMTAQGYTSARATAIDNLDATVSSRAAPGDAMDLVVDAVDAAAIAANAIDSNAIATDAIDAAALATTAVNEIRDSILADSTPFNGGLIPAIYADTSAIDGRLPSDPADESLQQAAHTQTQADIAALTDIDQAGVQAALTAQGYTAARAPNLDNLDAAVTTRAAPGAAMDLVTDAVDATSLATSAVDEIADQVWEETLADHSGTVGSTAEALDNVSTPAAPATIAAAVWDEALAGHTTGGTAGEAQNRIDVDVSSRSDHDAADVDTQLSGTHGSGAWDGTDWSGTERNQIRGALGIVGVQANPAGGGDLQDILADTAAIDARLPSDPADESLQQASHTQTQADIAALQDLSQADVQTALTAQGYTAARAPALDNLDAAVSTRSDHTPGQVDTQLSGTHGAGSWESAAATQDWSAGEREQIRDALGVDGDKTTATGGQVQDILTDTNAIDTRLPADPADESLQQASHTATQAAIASVSGDTTAIQTQVNKIDSAATTGASGAATGSLLDVLANKDGAKEYDQSTDSLQAIRDKIGGLG